jgi:hypothetical protein
VNVNRTDPSIPNLHREEVVLATEEELKRAYKAFKKRLKLARLDDASGLGRGGSKQSSIAGITPPNGFPPGVWDELVAQGKLKREGSGTYSLAQEL